MQESEITVQIFDSFSVLKEKLVNNGFVFVGKYKLEDHYFIKDKDIDPFSYKELISKSLLVRKVIEKKTKSYLIYKKKDIDKDNVVLSEEKVKVEVANFENTLRILQFINMNNWCNIENNSYVYKKDNIEIIIQDIKGLGLFIELEEYKQVASFNKKDKINAMIDFIKSFNFKLGEDFSCKKVYMKFLLEK